MRANKYLNHSNSGEELNDNNEIKNDLLFFKINKNN